MRADPLSAGEAGMCRPLEEQYVDIRDRDVPKRHDTGFSEPLSPERNTTLPHPAGLESPPVLCQEYFRETPMHIKHIKIRERAEKGVEAMEKVHYR